jgi:hypothetical protein
MPRTDSFGTQHISLEDQVTDQGLDHVESRQDCANAHPAALYFARARSAAFTPNSETNANNANANADVRRGVRVRDEAGL